MLRLRPERELVRREPVYRRRAFWCAAGIAAVYCIQFAVDALSEPGPRMLSTVLLQVALLLVLWLGGFVFSLLSLVRRERGPVFSAVIFTIHAVIPILSIGRL